MRIVAAYGRESRREGVNISDVVGTLQRSAENVQKGVFDDGGHDGGVRICVSSWVTGRVPTRFV